MNKKLTLAFGLLALMIKPVFADPAAAGKIKHIYDITRNGSKIGTQAVEIDKQGETKTVKVVMHVSVTAMMVKLYYVDLTSSETWNGGQLVSFKSQTDEHGTKHNVSATSAGDKIHVDADGKSSEAPRKSMPSSLWSKPLTMSGSMFDDRTGKLLTVKISDLGDETLTMNGTPHLTHHYRIAGDIERDLWFDNESLVRMRLTGADGSKIISDLRL